jgi:hypothetical protein
MMVQHHRIDRGYVTRRMNEIVSLQLHTTPPFLIRFPGNLLA